MRGYRMSKAFAVILLVMLLTLLGAFGMDSIYAECPGNILLNPSFEEGFSERGAGEVKVANGWQPFWQDGPFQNEGYNRRPEYQPEEGPRFGYRRIKDGHWAQKMFNTFATHHAGVFQQINVPPGSTVRLTAWAQAWSSVKDDPATSSGGKYYMSVGIDPTGGTNFNAPTIVWSAPSTALDQWVQLSVEAKAQAGTVTVFLRGDAEWRVKHNDVYFDDACVTYSAPPPPTPKPTNTPTPTFTPTPTPVPTPTPEPAVTSEAPPPLQETGSIRLVVFDDQNGNGLRDEGEPLVSGAEITLGYMQGSTLASWVTDASAGPFLLEGLQPGNYVIREKDPPGYISETPNEWAITVLGGTQLEVQFADRVGPTPTFTPQPTPTKPPEVAPTAPAPQPAPTQPSAPTSESDPLDRLREAVRGLSGLLVAVVAFILPLAVRRFSRN